MNLSNNTILITGGTSGIGFELAKQLSKLGNTGFQNDTLEIRPGQANQLKFMSRLAPEFILKQLSRPVERMLASVKH